MRYKAAQNEGLDLNHQCFSFLLYFLGSCNLVFVCVWTYNQYPLLLRSSKSKSTNGCGSEDWSLELVLRLEESPGGEQDQEPVQV